MHNALWLSISMNDCFRPLIEMDSHIPFSISTGRIILPVEKKHKFHQDLIKKYIFSKFLQFVERGKGEEEILNRP